MLEGPVFAQRGLGILPQPLPIVGMNQVAVGDPAAQKVIQGIARELAAAVAEELSGPIAVVAATVRHAHQVAEEARQ